MTTMQLTPMQEFFLQEMKRHGKPMSPNHLSVLWYSYIGKHRNADSRSNFGKTSAAYRTCRKLVELGLANQITEKTSGGYTNLDFSAK
jgi:hypothetical protein